jgi:TPP-dependent pyruvate/acetoin dehydrogenase alpha subunit
MKLNKQIKLYKNIYKIREVEKKISSLYVEQQMRCPVHLSIGQEAIPVGICENLNSSDQVLSAHRAHAHYLAKGGSLKAMISELYGKVTGCAMGKGGSMHLIDISAGMMAAVPIVGSTIPIAVGFAWANKLTNSKKVVVVFFGDGATEEGVFHESLDFASLHKLPILFVCENNFYSVYSNINKRQSKSRNICKIANAVGIKSLKINGNNLSEIFNKSKKIINNIRNKSHPFLVELNTYRLVEHCGPNNDDNLNYRSKSEISYWKKKCPVKLFKKKILSQKVKKNYLIKIEKQVQKEINDAFAYAKKSKFPRKELLTQHIYAK